MYGHSSNCCQDLSVAAVEKSDYECAMLYLIIHYDGKGWHLGLSPSIILEALDEFPTLGHTLSLPLKLTWWE